MSVSAMLDRFQRRHPGAGFPLAVLYEYSDDSGAYLAALIAYYGFVSLFPLLLLMTTILGFVLSGHPACSNRFSVPRYTSSQWSPVNSETRNI